jgi:hypothetical protein
MMYCGGMKGQLPSCKKNAFFWDVMPYGSCENRYFGGMYRLHHQGENTKRARINADSNYHLMHAAKECGCNMLLTLFPARDTLLQNFKSYILSCNSARDKNEYPYQVFSVFNAAIEEK